MRTNKVGGVGTLPFVFHLDSKEMNAKRASAARI